MRDIERDILLASSGELSRWRRTRLAWRLRRDPEARRQAETLALTELVLSPGRALQRGRALVGWLAAAAVTATAIGLALVLRGAFTARAIDTERSGTSTVVAVPLYESTRRLLVAGYTMTPGAQLVAAESFDAPLLPPWSAGFEDETVWDLIDERSQ